MKIPIIKIFNEFITDKIYNCQQLDKENNIKFKILDHKETFELQKNCQHEWSDYGYHVHDFLIGWVWCKICVKCHKWKIK